jgi:hypothetical protein
MEKTFTRQLREEFDLPVGIATWVAATHIWVLASPLALIWAVDIYADALPTALVNVTLVKIASAIYMASTAFEVAQNSADRWYLTEATRSVADMVFNVGMTFAFCLYTIAFTGFDWLAAVALAITVVYPVLYVRTTNAHRAIGGLVTLIATISLFLVTRDPAAFLFMVGNYFGAYLITLMIQNGSQSLHGWGAFMFGLGYLSWPLAIVNAANGTPMSWTQFGVITAVVIVVGAALTPLMRKMPKTPHTFA